MEEIVLDIPFDNDDFQESAKVIWSFSNQKRLKWNIICAVLSVILLIELIFFNDVYTNFPLVWFFTGYPFYVGINWVGYFERRVRYFKKIKNYPIGKSNEALSCHIVLSDYGIQCQGSLILQKVSWSLLKFSKVSDSHLLLILKDDNRVFTCFSKKNLGDANFQKLQSVLAEKLL